jgi:signal transduction histidine kinase
MSDQAIFRNSGDGIGIIDSRGQIEAFSVTDEGYGVPQGRRHELFEPFNRLGVETGNIKGSGVGLAITKGLVEMIDDRIEVVSEEDLGSTFTVHLPLKAETESG